MSAPAEFTVALGAEERQALLAIGHRRRAETGEVLLSEARDADRVIILVDGRVKVTVATRAGSAAVLGFSGPGALLGEQAALDTEPRAATVTAIEPVEYVVIPASAFRRHLRERPDVALELAAYLSRRLRNANRKRAEHVAADTSARVASRLVELAEEYGLPDGDRVRIALPLTQTELAGWSGASLEAVAKVLRTLRTAGWVETGRREVVLRDVAALRGLAGDA